MFLIAVAGILGAVQESSYASHNRWTGADGTVVTLDGVARFDSDVIDSWDAEGHRDPEIGRRAKSLIGAYTVYFQFRKANCVFVFHTEPPKGGRSMTLLPAGPEGGNYFQRGKDVAVLTGGYADRRIADLQLSLVTESSDQRLLPLRLNASVSFGDQSLSVHWFGQSDPMLGYYSGSVFTSGEPKADKSRLSSIQVSGKGWPVGETFHWRILDQQKRPIKSEDGTEIAEFTRLLNPVFGYASEQIAMFGSYSDISQTAFIEFAKTTARPIRFGRIPLQPIG